MNDAQTQSMVDKMFSDANLQQHGARLEYWCLTDFKVARRNRRAREQTWKDHEDWYRQISADVSISNLNVLNFRC